MASRSIHIMAFGLIFSLFSGPVLAAKCGNTSKGFSHWVVQFKKEARKKASRKERCGAPCAGSNMTIPSLKKIATRSISN